MGVRSSFQTCFTGVSNFKGYQGFLKVTEGYAMCDTFLKSCNILLLIWLLAKKLSKPRPNHNSTKHNLSWVWHENDFTPPPPTTKNSMSAISQQLLTRFWLNFKGSFLGASRTDSNYQVDTCPGNICPGDICPYQEYLSCYWPDFDKT